MQPSQWEIIILKPTRVFLAFLASQLPHVILPSLRQLQADTTAYVINKFNSDEDTFNEIERHFATMFRHEIYRCIGEEARTTIEGSFLDFLCCFKFELHSQIILKEPSLVQGRQLLRIKPRSVLLGWLKSSSQEESEFKNVLERVSLANLAENATVIVKNFDNSDEVKTFSKDHYPLMFEAEMLRMCDSPENWPLVDSYQSFCRYFAIETHTQLVNLC